MKAMLDDPVAHTVEGRGAGRRYHLGQIPAAEGSGSHSIVLALAQMGNTSAATRASLLLDHFEQIDSIIMVGIAGGVPWPQNAAEHVRLGDVVVSDKYGVVQFDYRKETSKEIIIRSAPRPPSAELLEAVALLRVQELEGDSPWLRFFERCSHLPDSRRPQEKTDLLTASDRESTILSHPEDPDRVPEQPKVFHGPIASSNTLLKNPKKRDALRDQYRVKAIEMEAAGIADATWHHQIGYLVVRGICDYCDSRKNDTWQMYAAIAAAAYTRALLESKPVSESYSEAGEESPKQQQDDDGPYRCMVQRPDGFVHRSEFDAIVNLICSAADQNRGTIGITTALRGAGGFGKTMLAQAIAFDKAIRRAFTDGILWVSIGEEISESARLSRILDLVRWWSRSEPPVFETSAAAAAYLRKELEGLRVLLIVDDVWQSRDIKIFRGLGKGSAVLFTTRDSKLLPTECLRVNVDAMSESESVELLASGLPLIDSVALKQLSKRLGDWPLLLRLVNSQIREIVEDGVSAIDAIYEIERELDELGVTAFDVHDDVARENAVSRTLEVGLRRLSREERDHFESLAIFPEDLDIPLDVANRLWSLKKEDVWSLCSHLYELSLVLSFHRSRRTIRLHDVVRQYLLRLNSASLRACHYRLLQSYRQEESIDQDETRWHEIPNDGYIYRFLTWHLQKAGLCEEILELLFEETAEGQNAWYRARENIGELAGYTEDLQRARSIAVDGKAELSPADIANICRLALMQASLCSLVFHIGPKTIKAALKQKIWSPEDALQRARSIPDQERSQETLCEIVAMLTPELRPRVLTEILNNEFIWRSSSMLEELIDRMVEAKDVDALIEARSGVDKIADKLKLYSAVCRRVEAGKHSLAHAVLEELPLLASDESFEFLHNKYLRLLSDLGILDDAWRIVKFIENRDQVSARWSRLASKIKDALSDASAYRNGTPSPSEPPRERYQIQVNKHEDRKRQKPKLAPLNIREMRWDHLSNTHRLSDWILEARDEFGHLLQLHLLPESQFQLVTRSLSATIRTNQHIGYVDELLIWSVASGGEIRKLESLLQNGYLCPKHYRRPNAGLMYNVKSVKHSVRPVRPDLPWLVGQVRDEMLAYFVDKLNLLFSEPSLQDKICSKTLAVILKRCDVLDDADKCSVVTSIVDRAPQDLLPQAAAILRSIGDQELYSEAIMWFSTTDGWYRMNSSRWRRGDVFHAIWQEGKFFNILEGYSLYLNEDDFLGSWQLDREIDTLEKRSSTVLRIIERLVEFRVSKQALQLVADIADRERRSKAIEVVAGNLRDVSLFQCVEVAIQYRVRSSSLSNLVARLRSAELNSTLDLLSGIGDKEYTLAVLDSLSPSLNREQLKRAIAICTMIGDYDERAQLSGAVMSSVRESELCDPMQLISAVKDKERRASLLIELAPELPAESLRILIQDVAKSYRGELKARVIRSLFIFYSEKAEVGDLVELTEWIWCLARSVIKKEGIRESIRVSRISSSEEEWLLREFFVTILSSICRRGVAFEFIHFIRKIKDSHPYWCSDAVANIAPLVSAREVVRLFKLVSCIKHRRWRSLALARIAKHLPSEKRLLTANNCLASLAGLSLEYEKSEIVSALAPHLEEELFSDAVAIVESFEDVRWRAEALAALAAAANERWDIVELAARTAESIPNRFHREQVFATLMPVVPDVIRSRMVSDIFRDNRYIRERSVFFPYIGPELKVQIITSLVQDVSQSGSLESLLVIFDLFSTDEELCGVVNISFERLLGSLEVQQVISHSPGSLEGWREVFSYFLPVVSRSGLCKWFVRQLFASSSGTRSDVLFFLRCMMPLLLALGGSESLKQLSEAVQDVGRWWP